MPQDLMVELRKQKGGCERIISSKDELIKEFNNELKSKDEDYVKALKQQEEDITQLLSRMRKQYNDLHKEYEVELEQIEEHYKQETRDLLSTVKRLQDENRKLASSLAAATERDSAFSEDGK